MGSGSDSGGAVNAADGLLTAMSGFAIALEIKVPPYWWAFVLLALCWILAGAASLAIALFRNRKSRPA